MRGWASLSVLRLVGLVVIAGIIAAVFALVYPKFLAMSKAEKAKDAVDKLHPAIDSVINGSVSSTTVKIEIPKGYELTFKENQMILDGITREYRRSIDGEDFGSGEHQLKITIENHTVKVRRVG